MVVLQTENDSLTTEPKTQYGERMVQLIHAPLFWGRHFPDDIIILAVRWYLRYSLSYRDLEEILAERGVGATVDFYLSETRDVAAAELFLRKAMAVPGRMAPEEIVVDGNPTYPIAIRSLQRAEILPLSSTWRCSHNANNLIEQDHRGIQCRAKAKQYFRSLAGARHTTAGYEAMRMLRKGQVQGCERDKVVAQAHFVHRLLTLA
jgi:transposase-like protein